MSQTPEQYIVITVSQNNPWLMNRDTHTHFYITLHTLYCITLHYTDILTSTNHDCFGWEDYSTTSVSAQQVSSGSATDSVLLSDSKPWTSCKAGGCMWGVPPSSSRHGWPFPNVLKPMVTWGSPTLRNPHIYIYCRGVVMFFVVMLRNIFYLFEGGKCRTWSDRNCICMVPMGTLLWHIHSFNY